MISIVCVYNNKSILEEYLLKSLITQGKEHDVILVNNTTGQYRSAASALNFGGGKAKGNYIMFVHQDVYLCSENWLDEAENLLRALPDLGIAGVAGKSEVGKNSRDRERNIVWHGISPKILKWGKKLQNPEKVQTVDELLTIIPRDVFKKLKFDEKVCDDWHLYAVDYCLSTKRMGFSVYAIPMDVYHRGDNAWRLSERKYEQQRSKLARKYMFRYRKIYTSCGDFYTLYWALCPLVLISLFQKAFSLSKSFAKVILQRESR